MLRLRGKKVLVMGLGLLGGGQAVTEWLLAEGANVTVTDMKTKRELAKTVKHFKGKKIVWHLGGHSKKDFTSHHIIIQNPGVPKGSPYLAIARAHDIPVYNEAALFFLLAKRPIIAVTGTRGKSTTSSLIYEALKLHDDKTLLAGNRGDVPMLAIANEARKKSASPIVLELSSWQVEGLAIIQKSPQIAVLTNLYPDHLNRYATLDDYYSAKEILFAYQAQSDIAFFNADNTPSCKASKHAPSTVKWFSTERELSEREEGVYKKGASLFEKTHGKTKCLIDLRTVLMRGAHNQSNMAAAAAAAREWGVSSQHIQLAFNTFSGLWGRQQNLGVVRGIRFINDTTATTADGLIACIATYPQSVFIIGGQNKDLSYEGLQMHATKRNIKSVILLPGSASEVMLKILRSLPLRSRPKIRFAQTLTSAFTTAVAVAGKGGTVILSPGAASFNLFLNEFDRGQQFEKLVKQYAVQGK